MAQKRMLDKKISLSEKVAGLDLLGQLIYTWMIPHADDFGLLQASPRTIKALVVPMVDCTGEQVGIQLDSMRNTGLIQTLKILDKEYYKIVGSENNQTLKNDRQPQTILPVKLVEDKNHSWEIVHKLVDDAVSSTYGIQMETVGIQTVPEEKRREEKIINNGSAEAPQVKKNDSMKTTNGMSSIKDVLARRSEPVFTPAEEKIIRVHNAWQEKALRYADDLKLVLAPHAMGRWMKMFKQADAGRNSANIEKAYSFIVDYPKPLSNEEKMMFFFKIYERGLSWMQKTT